MKYLHTLDSRQFLPMKDLVGIDPTEDVREHG